MHAIPILLDKYLKVCRKAHLNTQGNLWPFQDTWASMPSHYRSVAFRSRRIPSAAVRWICSMGRCWSWGIWLGTFIVRLNLRGFLLGLSSVWAGKLLEQARGLCFFIVVFLKMTHFNKVFGSAPKAWLSLTRYDWPRDCWFRAVLFTGSAHSVNSVDHLTKDRFFQRWFSWWARKQKNCWAAVSSHRKVCSVLQKCRLLCS